MMVMIGPAQAERVLACLLKPGGAVATLPVITLGLEPEIAGPVAPEIGDRRVRQTVGDTEALGVGRQVACASAERFEVTHRFDPLVPGRAVWVEPAKAVPFDHPHLRFSRCEGSRYSKTGEFVTLYLTEEGKPVRGREVNDRLNFESYHRPCALAHEDAGENCSRVLVALPSALGGLANEAGGPKSRHQRAARRYFNVINPIAKPTPGVAEKAM